MAFRVEIDPNSGFCFGVINAINKAEQFIQTQKKLYSLGDIVHNNGEVNRLANLGLNSISSNEYSNLSNANVLFRAHGEPPASYLQAAKEGLKVIDATCPVVLKLQRRVKKAYHELKQINGQLVIFGKVGHPEVIGLQGQIEDNATLINHPNDISTIDPLRPVELFSQTTMSIDGFNLLIQNIKQHLSPNTSFVWHDTICRQVAGRVPKVAEFAKRVSVLIFVGGVKSSNAKVLYNECLKVNTKSYFISSVNEIKQEWFTPDVTIVGITGATSTPRWQLDEVADFSNQFNHSS